MMKTCQKQLNNFPAKLGFHGNLPCPIKTKPVRVMMMRARILATVKMSCTLVAAFTLAKLINVKIPVTGKENIKLLWISKRLLN